jgi:hypothetical protein
VQRNLASQMKAMLEGADFSGQDDQREAGEVADLAPQSPIDQASNLATSL